MSYQTYIGSVTILGVPNQGVIEGLGVFDPITFGIRDGFKLAEQYDTNGDVARITAYQQIWDATVTFYPLGDIAATDFPEPISRVVVTPSGDLPCPRQYIGTWGYVGGDIQSTNNGLLTFRMHIRRWNPKFVGTSYTPRSVWWT